MKICRGLLVALILFAGTRASAETRCGWFENPTPNNAWLEDAEGSWIMATQGAGGFNADGDWPAPNRSSKAYWAVAPGAPQDGYGYGCACAKVVSEKGQMLITKIISTKAKPLSACRRDPKLAKIEPKF